MSIFVRIHVRVRQGDMGAVWVHFSFQKGGLDLELAFPLVSLLVVLKFVVAGVLGSETTTGPAAAKAPGVTATSGMGVSGGGGATSGGAGSSSTATSTHKASDQTPAEVVRLDEPPASVQPSRRRAKKGFCTLL